MNEASLEKPRRRRLSRIAAATAAVLGATLLAYPGGIATAQTTDCAALGDNPMADGLEAALATAITCGVEVRIADRATAYSTLYATPDRQLHLVATADPVQEQQDQGLPDATLVDSGAGLTQTESAWPFSLGTASSSSLVTTRDGRLDWDGEIPAPAYSGSTAVYDELSPGLDLAVTTDVASAELRFTVADAEAWASLSSGLAVDPDSMSADEYGIFASTPGDGEHWEWVTPIAVRDAGRTLNRASAEQSEDGSLSMNLADGVLDSAVFPLAVSTSWAYYGSPVSQWNVLTSASPDFSFHRGNAGMDVPYFEAAGESGDAVVGAYCDAAVSAECIDAQAATYWSFASPQPRRLIDDYTYFYVGFPVSSAAFTVDSAAGTACTTPDLQRVEGYVDGGGWADLPEEALAATGSCQGETAVYDVTESVARDWDYSPTHSPLTFGMTEVPETARFKGGSARLDVHFDIANHDVTPACNNMAGTARYQTSSSLKYGDFSASIWRADLVDPGLTWTATIIDSDAGATLRATEPAAVRNGVNPVSTLTGLDDGAYLVKYQFASDDPDYSESWNCHIVIDSAKPEVIDIEVTTPGQHYIGRKVTVEVTVADEGFPDGQNVLTVTCNQEACADGPEELTLTEGSTTSFIADLDSGSTGITATVEDKAGNISTAKTLWIQATENKFDYNGDGYQDLYSVRKSDGALVLYRGKGDGTFRTAIVVKSGWGHMDVVMAGDAAEHGFPDLIARDTKTGNLYVYPVHVDGWGDRILVGSGWNGIGVFTADDFNGDGRVDILGVSKADGKLYFYPGQDNGKFGARTAVGTGWGVMDSLTAAGDLNDDGKPDLLAHDSRTGQYYLYQGSGAGNLGSRVTIAASLDGSGSDRYNQIIAVGDTDGDGKEDLIAIDSRTGELELHSLNGNGTAVHAGKVIATAWGGNRLAAVNEERTYDYSGDGKTDVLVRRGSDGKLYFYSGNGTGGLGTIGSWGTDLKNLNLIETAGDFNGDGFSDVIGRVASTGALYLFPGKGNSTYDYAARKQIGTGWNSMGAIVSGSDYNGDGKVDVIARETSTGYLWLYSGKGDGTIGSRVKIGTGWNAMREITAAGDLDHDGHADVIAIRSSDNCMYFYGGRGDGTLKAGVQTSCSWAGYESVASVGDFNGDGHADWIARRKSDGAVYLYKGNGAGGYSSRAQIASGWTWANAIA